ncbi:MAG: gamma-glutamyl-gamma-aminobutyrate hydrolase family protein [Ignavibacteriales bacterium]|nr:gamma-glutamyl-gamma-aminobutyrate hydrolase family protein [Ignavibacteriales bacterium]
MRIGITDCLKEDKYNLYVRWITNIEPEVEIAKLSQREKNVVDVSELDGLLLTGGGDVHPRFYGMEKHLSKTEGVDEARDAFELEIIDKALDNDIPVFGICRGMQLMNVYLGGELILDLESEGFEKHRSVKDAENVHSLTIHPHSLLREITSSAEIMVNSSHHQSVKKLGRGLMATALSPDGVTEAAEWTLKEGMPFLTLVQWHPERMIDDSVSKNLASMFLREVQHSKRMKATTL